MCLRSIFRSSGVAGEQLRRGRPFLVGKSRPSVRRTLAPDV
jgi:hypothetical protein